MITVFMRTLIIYLMLIISVRLTGKRQIGELQVTEFIAALMLSDIASLPIIDKSAPLSYALVPILLILSLEVICSFAVSKVPFLKRLMIGSPVYIIYKGKLVQSELAHNRIDVYELMSELRLNGVASPDDVYYAILEENGKLSVITKKDAGADGGFAHVLIADGKVSREGLTDSGMNDTSLARILKDAKTEADDVFLLTADDAGNTVIIKKEKKR